MFSLTGRSFWRSCQYERPDVAAWQQELTAQRMPFSARAAEIGVPVTPAIEETLHLLSTPANAEALRLSIRQLDAGKGRPRKLVGK